MASAASVLGLDPDEVQRQVAEARRAAAESRDGRPVNGNGSSEGNGPQRETVTVMGREVPVPEGHTAAEVEAIFTKMRSGGGPQSLNAEERQLLQAMRDAGGGRGGRQADDNAALFGGDYVVFILRDGQPAPMPVRTGLTDLDYSEVVSGLTEADTVLIMPSASLLASQQQLQEWAQRRAGGVIPGSGGGRR
jgi:hypothetical protein